jgi:high-affinity Fe2+/Pb2+ permease
VVLIYAFTQWLASLALVAANAEMRFLWLALATAVLVWVVVRSQRALRRDAEAASEGAVMPAVSSDEPDRLPQAASRP